MDRRLLAYLLLAILAIVVAALFARARYYSRHRVLRRQRLADEANSADRARRRAELAESTD